MKILAILAVSVILGACADSRQVGSVLDPLCMPDGSVVRAQYANDEGSFDGVVASRENCPWNQ